MAVGAQIPNSALTSFASQIIKGFGFDALGTQYMQIPGGAVQFLTLIAGGFICTHWPGMRCITMTIANLICIAGAALLVGLPDTNKVTTLHLTSFSVSANYYLVGTSRGPLAMLFPVVGLQHFSDHGLFQYCRVDEEAVDRRHSFYRILRWER